MTIGLTAAIMARLYGFQSDLTHRQSRFQSLGIIAIFLALAVPLGFSLRTIAWEANGQRIVNQEVAEAFTDRARVEQPIVNWAAKPGTVSASVFTPEFNPSADTDVAERLAERLGRPVVVTIDQFQVGTDPRAAEQAALAQARRPWHGWQGLQGQRRAVSGDRSSRRQAITAAADRRTLWAWPALGAWLSAPLSLRARTLAGESARGSVRESRFRGV